MIAIAMEEMSIIHRVTCEGVAQIRIRSGKLEGAIAFLNRFGCEKLPALRK